MAYNPEIAKKICELIATNSKSLKKLIEENDLPPISTIYDWLASHKEFSEMYARAKEDQAELLADEIIEIADDSSNDVEYDERTGKKIENKEFVNRSKLRVDARKWVAAKLKPKKYGDKIETDNIHRIIEQPLFPDSE